MTDLTPRIAPLDDAQWAPELQPVAEKLKGHYLGLVNLHRTLANHPGQFRQMLAFGSRILRSTLDPRLRELIILRTAWVRQAEYEWAHHVIVGRAAGLTDAEILAIKQPAQAGAWTPIERALLEAVDTLATDSTIDDAVWETLRTQFSEPQLIDVIMTVGTYTMLGMALKGLRVELDPELQALEEHLRLGAALD